MTEHKVRHGLQRIPVAFQVVRYEAPAGTVPPEPPAVVCTAAQKAQWTREHIVFSANVAGVYYVEVW